MKIQTFEYSKRFKYADVILALNKNSAMIYTIDKRDPDSEAAIRNDIIERVAQMEASTSRPPFLLVRAVNQYDRSEFPTPRVFALSFNEENLDAALRLGYRPEDAWEVLNTSEVGSDLAVRVISSHSVLRPEEYPDLWEVTHIALYDSRHAYPPRDATMVGYFNNLINIFPHLEDNNRYTGHFFRYKVNTGVLSAVGSRFRDQFCSLGDLKNRFQIEVDYAKLASLNEDGHQCADPIFSIPCMVYALQRQKVKAEVIKELMENVHGNGNFKMAMVTKVLKKHGIKCSVRRIQDCGDGKFKVNCNERGLLNKDASMIRLAFWQEHWMSDEDVEWCNKKGTVKTVPFIRVLEECRRNNVLVPINAFELAQSYSCYSFDQMLSFDVMKYVEEGQQKEIIERSFEAPSLKNRKECPPIIGFADFESATNEQYHFPFSVALSWLDENEENITYFEGQNCVNSFAKAIVDKCYSRGRPKGVEARIYFYNLKYDWTLFRGILKDMKTVESGNKLYSLTAKIGQGTRSVQVEFWDLLPITMCRLKDAGKAYLTEEQQRSIKKEYIPYSFYTVDRVKRALEVSFLEFVEYWRKENNLETVPPGVLESIKETAIKAGAYKKSSDTIDFMRYNRYYNIQDVKILRNVAVNLSKLFAGGKIDGIDENTNPIALDMWKYRTASSIGYDYFWKHCIMRETDKGWVPRFPLALPKMQLRYIIQKSIRGGRVMVRDNKKIRYDASQNSGVLIQDYDGVSLYPSAMSKLWITEGNPELIRGKFTEDDFKRDCSTPDGSLSTYKDMIVHVTFINTKKFRHFPLLCVKDPKTKLNNYKNFDNETVDTWVNAIDLWNLIDFQNATFTYDAALVWTGDRHYEIRTMIQHLFDFRLANKSHPIQAVAKLMMNSIYGKSTMKARKTERYYIDKLGWRKRQNGPWEPVDKWAEWFSTNAYRVYSLEEETNNVVKVDTFYRDCGSCFNIFGSNVLAMARRIIGRVMALAEDVEEMYPAMSPGLFYTDTDSMHIRSDLLTLVEKHYKLKYGEDLCGKQLCQFHVDFSPVNGKETLGARKSIFLGKKMYADELINVDNEVGFHFRMKGIPNKALDWGKYEQIWQNEKVEFNLLEYGPSFFYEKGKVGSRRVMTRKIGIDSDETEEYIERPDSELDSEDSIDIGGYDTEPETIVIRKGGAKYHAELVDGAAKKIARTELDGEITDTESCEFDCE